MIGFAHRGGMADAPENSLAAFQKALAAGANGLESDVWLDATGVPVLHHGPPHKEKRTPLALAELFAQCGTDFDLSLDLKGPGTSEATVAVATGAGFDLQRLWLVGGQVRKEPTGPRLVTDLTWPEALWGRQRAFERIAASGIDAVNLRHGRWSRSLVSQAHEAGLLAFAWDINNRLALRWAVRRGVDAIYSDHVRLLHDARRLR